ncbi:MAG: DMT family transporter [Gammaproteobacteria bacterium]|nr:DMT family transporter [Gammaproteobacteria bacterium]
MKLNKYTLLGIAITLVGSLCYVLMSAVSKITGQHLSINYIIFLQSLSGLLCSGIFLKISGYRWKQLWRSKQTFYLPRIVLSLASIYSLIYGLKYVSVFNALVILNSAPLIIPLLRFIILKKKINSWIFPGVLFAFFGMLLILAPDQHIIEPAILVIIFSMLCMALSLLCLENYRTADPKLAIFYYFLLSSIIVASLLMTQPEFFNFSIRYISLGIIIGILFFFVQLSVVYASRYISSQLISILFYSEIMMALLASMIFENLQPNFYRLLGSGLVILGGLLVVLIENKENVLKFKV